MNEETKNAIDNLNRRGFKAVYFSGKDEALQYVLEHAGDSDIGIGGSMTVSQLGWYNALASRGNVYWHAKTPGPETMRRAGEAPCYMLSANAVSQNGDIVNIDANGNRITAAACGCKKTFYICGENKITENLERAIWRAKNIAAPLNAKRLQRKTPCAIKADKCHNCSSPERICRVTTITTRPPSNMDVHVIVISGSWGY